MADAGRFPPTALETLESLPAPEPELSKEVRIEGVVIAELVELREGDARIRYLTPNEGCSVFASCACALSGDDLGAQLAVVFLGADPERPLILAKLEHPVMPAAGQARAQELVFEAEHRITLRCGRSSISMTRDGRLELRGQHLLSRATSVNRIRGGVIQLN